MPKAREQFAEFLDQDSLARFGILYQTTSVGFGYGRPTTSRRSFSRPTGSPDIGPRGPPSSRLAPYAPGFAWGRGRTLDQGKPPPRPATRPRHSTRSATTHPRRTAGRHPPRREGTRHRTALPHGSRLSVVWPVREYPPVHPFDYACRPRLRTRLTQGRRTWPWNPWSSSGRDPHPALATHVCILTPTQSTAGLPRRFDPVWDALLPRRPQGRRPRLRWRA